MTGKPFFFDAHIFDDEGASKQSKPMPEKPEFTKTELLHERDKAFAEGKKNGEKTALESIEQKTLQLIEKINRDIAILIAAEDDRNKRYEAEATHLSLSFIQKIFPLLSDNQGVNTLKKSIKDALQNNKTPDEITVKVHPDMAEKLEVYISSIEHGFQKNITIIKQDDIAPFDCTILWQEGGVILNHTKIVEESFELIKQALADHNINVHDTAAQDKHTKEENNEDVEKNK